MIILLLIIFLIIFFPSRSLVRMRKLKKRCTEQVDAEVVDIADRTSKGKSYGFHVYGFTYNGNSYRIKSNFAAPSMNFEIGEMIELYIDPDDANVYYCPKEIPYRRRFNLVFIVFGIIMLLIPIAALFVK